MCPNIVPDFSQAAGLDSGTYMARIVGSEEKIGKESGNPYINWKLTTTGNAEAKDNNQVIFHITPFTGPGAGLFKTFVEAALGEPVGDEIANFETEALHSREVMMTVEKEAGRAFAKVKSVAAVGV